MKPIASIRVYQSTAPNTDGHSLPYDIDNKPLHLALRRIAMKLRENGFSLGDFDHLYLNLTLCPVPGGIALAQRSAHRENAWLRYYDVQVEQRLYNQLGSEESYPLVFSLVEETLTRHFATPAFPAERICACMDEAISQGEAMLMAFKEKATAKRKAMLFLRLLDSGCYHPLLRVLDMDGGLLLEADLPRMTSLDTLGDIQVGLHKVTIKPRKSSYTEGLEPLSFEY